MGEFSLLPYRRAKRPARDDAHLQAQIDAVLAPYISATGRPVQDAVIVRLANCEITADLTEDDAVPLFVFAELLAFSGLSDREFFGSRYCNRDSFRIVIQGFRPESHTVVIVSRRRDGATHNIMSAGTYQVPIPPHASRYRVDERQLPLLKALLEARENRSWGQYHEAISSFNLANTDTPDITQTTEAILMIGALQRLLECRSGSANQLAERFYTAFQPTETVSPSNCQRESAEPQITAAFRRRTAVREAWIHDFYALRGQFAHGTLEPRYPSIWTVHEHLLLGALAFPLLVKLLLSRDGLYQLSDEDRMYVDAFEPLACAHHFDQTEDFPDRSQFAWAKIMSRAKIHQLFAELYSQSEEGAAEDQGGHPSEA